MNDEIKRARAVQIKQVMPLIGPLLDAWDDVPNDTKGTLREEAPTLCDYLDKIENARHYVVYTTSTICCGLPAWEG